VRTHVVVIGTAAVAVTSAWLTLPLRAAGQSSTGAPKAQARARHASEKSGTITRLPDGSPDIRGTWTRVGGGLNEAKAPETELKPFGVLAEPQGFGQGQVAAGPGGGVSQRRVPRYVPNPRPPQGIIDPSDKVLPYTPEGLALRLDYAKNMCCPAKSLGYLELSLRCAPPQPWAGSGVHILQRPGEVVLLFEANHQNRVFYADGRRHPSSAMRFFGGHSIGHWEGNTFVADTTNLDGRAYFGVGNTFAPFSKELHLTERFTVVSDKLITFELTYDDPKTFTRPVKSAGYFYPVDDDEELAPEFTCHEGSYSMPNVFGF
jgi:hypothetical protein